MDKLRKLLMERKKIELELYTIIDNELSSRSFISLSDLLTIIQNKDIASQSLKFSKYFQCENCLKASIMKFPSSFFISQKKKISKTTAINKLPNIYHNYMNYSVIGCAVSEALIACTSLLAKLQLYQYLLSVLRSESLFLDALLRKIYDVSDACKSVFLCEHILIEAINGFPDVLSIKSTILENGITEKLYVEFIPAHDSKDMGKEYNSDCLLEMIQFTFFRLTAEIQLNKTLSEALMKCNNVSSSDFFKVVKGTSPSCKDYFVKLPDMNAVLSLLPDKFYTSKCDHILLTKNANCQKKYWFHESKFNFDSYDPLIYKLNEILSKELAIVNLIKIAKAVLKTNRHKHLTALKNEVIRNNYCTSYFKKDTDVKSAISKYPGIFHISKQKNVFLIENSTICHSHNTISESVLTTAMKTCEGLILEIFVYCFLKYDFINGSVQSVLLKELWDSLPTVCKSSNPPSQTMTSREKKTIIEIVNHYPGHFYYVKEKGYIIPVWMNTDPLNTSLTSGISGNASSYAYLPPMTEVISKMERLNTVEVDNVSTTDSCSSHISTSTPKNFSMFTKVKWADLRVLTGSGVMSVMNKTEGYIQLDCNICVPVIIDIVYANSKQVENLIDLDKKRVNCIAIEEQDGVVRENWKAMLVWIGSKPIHYVNAIESQPAWETIKLLYNQRYNPSIPLIPKSPKTNSVTDIPRLLNIEESIIRESKMESASTSNDDLKRRIEILELLLLQRSNR